MAFKTFTVGEVATASDANTMFMKQVLIGCTSGTRPGSPAEGWHIYETDTNRVWLHDGAAWQLWTDYGPWTTYSPAWTASGTAPSLGNGTLTGNWSQVGNTVHIRTILTMGSTTTFGTLEWRLSLPLGGKVRSQITAFAFDSSSGDRYSGAADLTATSATGDNMRINLGPVASVTNLVPFTWATGDILVLSGFYEIN